ncbi:MAG: glycosyl hydrolase [Nocardioides sp.]|uniref:glycosyl hydrolase n=1 Tax=Nocardioides sp. TaxID=35761 RepID=UPI0039E5997E
MRGTVSASCPTPETVPLDTSMSRRTVLQIGAILGAAGAVGATGLGAAAASTPATPGLGAAQVAGQFADPPARVRAGFRWWWPHGLVDPAEIAREVDAVADAGFGLLEISDVHHSVETALDPVGHGWGTAAWRAGVEAALTRAKARDLRVDMTIGPAWPAAVPTITPDSVAAAHELAHGEASVPSGTTFDGPLPDPVVAAADGVSARKLIAVQVAKVLERPAKPPVQLDPTSVTDVTDQVSDGTLTWTAPDDGGEWIVLSYWERGTAQQPESGPHTSPLAYVVDHFSAAGAQAVFDYWDEAVLTPTITRLLRQVGGNVFCDSIELEYDATLWTPGFLDEFRHRYGYDLTPYLSAIVQVSEKYAYVLDATLSGQVRFDVSEALGRLYVERHLTPVTRWARRLGMGLRLQAYGITLDSVAAAAILDVPEGESLGFKNLDDYRILASGRDIAGRSVLSCEAACYAGGAYNTTWQKALVTVGSFMAGGVSQGVSQSVFHGYPYRDVPGAAWPGFAAFSPYHGAPGYGEAWGPRMPSWRHVAPIADHLGRTQLVLQSGVPQTDVTIFRQRGAAGTGIGARYFTNDGIPIGWTHAFLTDAVMDLVPPMVRRGRLYPDGPAYKALILAGDPFASEETAIPLASARRILAMAEHGLPIVVVGDWSQAHGTGNADEAENAAIRRIIAELLGRSKVAVVSDYTKIPDGLAALGIERTVTHDSSTLMHLHRVVERADLFYLANARHAENRTLVQVSQDVTLTASNADALPYRLDTWTGAIEPIAQFTRDGARFTVRVTLNPGESTVIALAAPGVLTGRRRPARSVTATEADLVRYDGTRLVVRSLTGGTVTSTLDSGRTVSTTVAAPPAAPQIGTWTLEVEDWRPGDEIWETAVSTSTRTLDTLAAWTEIDGLEDVSGIGRYTTTLTLPADWTGAGAYLDLGTVFDTVKVTLNGTEVAPVSPLVSRIDLGRALRPGENTLRIETSTTLWNRLRTTSPEVFGSSARQSYGLLGPVKITPYREAHV